MTAGRQTTAFLAARLRVDRCCRRKGGRSRKAGGVHLVSSAVGRSFGFGRPPARGPTVSTCARPKAWGAKEASGLPHTRPLHMGAGHVVVRPGIWYAPGTDPEISRVLSACPTAETTAICGSKGLGGRWGCPRKAGIACNTPSVQ